MSQELSSLDCGNSDGHLKTDLKDEKAFSLGGNKYMSDHEMIEGWN